MLNPPKRGIDEYHNDSLSNIKKAKQSPAQLRDAAIKNWYSIYTAERTVSHGVVLSSSPGALINEY
jgi:hypothetical protein